MKAAVVFLIYLLHLTVGDNKVPTEYCTSANIPDYYWREFSGIIPHDAVPGGTDRAGLPTYIGQAMVYPWGQLPASIYQGNKTTVVASASLVKYRVDKNVKILCSGSLSKFSWIPTDTDKIQLITNCHLILGGVDVKHQENIGRVNYDEEIILGKVIRKPLDHDGLWVPHEETEVKFKSFEVLAYDCKKNNVDKVAAV